jgi:hypothetical protein
MTHTFLDESATRTAALPDRYWPPVPPFTRLHPELVGFIELSDDQQREFLAAIRHDAETHGSTLHCFLSEVNAYLFGYRDSPCAAGPDDRLEVGLHRAKVVLERELVDHWLRPAPVPSGLSAQEDAAAYLAGLTAANPGIDHELFDVVARRASRAGVERFLACELIRNEVVDDEVAMLVVGLQDRMKAAAAGNLWDECGHGRPRHFHTFWLRRLLDRLGGWDALAAYRMSGHPWFARVTSNVNAMLLSRPAYGLMAYGCFVTFESWVDAHFRQILRGMERVGLDDPDVRVYFTAHVAIDPLHTRQLLSGLRLQRPRLSPEQVALVVRGAHVGVAAGVAQFDRMARYLPTAT